MPPTPPDAKYDGMDPWQTSVETRLGQLHGSVEKLGEKIDAKTTAIESKIDSNFKWLIGAYALGFVALAGMMISGYLLLADKIGSLAH